MRESFSSLSTVIRSFWLLLKVLQCEETSSYLFVLLLISTQAVSGDHVHTFLFGSHPAVESLGRRAHLSTDSNKVDSRAVGQVALTS